MPDSRWKIKIKNLKTYVFKIKSPTFFAIKKFKFAIIFLNLALFECFGKTFLLKLVPTQRLFGLFSEWATGL